MSYAPKRIQLVRCKLGDGSIQADPFLWDVLSTDRNRAIVPGMFVVINAAGDVDGCRGVNDTTNAGDGAKLIVGYVKTIYDTQGRVKNVQYLGTSDAGKVSLFRVKGMGLVFSAVEDAVGGAMTLTGSCPIVDGTITNYTATESDAANPESNDKLDSSGRHATATQHACKIIGAVPDPRNTATAKVVEFELNDSYCY